MIAFWSMPGLFLLIMLLVGAGIAVFRLLACQRGWVAPVSERSSHSVPVPTGAGLVLGVVLVPVFCVLSWSQGEVWLWLGALAGVLSLLGWLDDRYDLPVWFRLAVQFAVCLLWFAYAGPQPGWIAPALMMLVGWLLAQLWFINLFNFMDGLDGFAASEALFVCLALILLIPDQAQAQWLWGVSAAAVVALLYWNWPPARVFMGDAGSLLLGFLLSAPVLWLEPVHIAVWLILVAAFVVDASLTLTGRFLQGQRLTHAHRSHLYQRLSAAGHERVVGYLWCLNVILLLPVAGLLAADALPAWLAVSLVYTLLTLLWLWLHARLRLEPRLRMQENCRASDNGQ